MGQKRQISLQPESTYNSFSRNSVQNSSGVSVLSHNPTVYVYPEVPSLFLSNDIAKPLLKALYIPFFAL